MNSVMFDIQNGDLQKKKRLAAFCAILPLMLFVLFPVSQLGPVARNQLTIPPTEYSILNM